MQTNALSPVVCERSWKYMGNARGSEQALFNMVACVCDYHRAVILPNFSFPGITRSILALPRRATHFALCMRKFPEIKTWLTIQTDGSADGTYQHLVAGDTGPSRAKVLPRLKALVSEAHDDARRRLRKLATGSLDPLAEPDGYDPAKGYPERLHLQTLKGYFGEIMSGMVAENLEPFGFDDWVVPAYLFRFHTVEFQQLDFLNQTGQTAQLRPGRTGDDCLAFRTKDGQVIAALFCEAKCTGDHDASLINDAHEKSSLPNRFPVDLLQLIELLLDSPDPTASAWVPALRRLNLRAVVAEYQRFDQVTYVCARSPARKTQTCWINSKAPHDKYTGKRHLHVAEIHLNDVERLIRDVYPIGDTAHHGRA